MIIQTVYIEAAGDPTVGIPSSSATIQDAHIDLDCFDSIDQQPVLEEFRGRIQEAFSELWDADVGVRFDFELAAEEAEMEPPAFQVTAKRHQGGSGYRAFPDGIWYGHIDDYPCTAPCGSKEAALSQAQASLKSGSFARMLRDNRAMFHEWLANVSMGHRFHTKARLGLAEIDPLLSKYEAAFPENIPAEV